MCRVFEQVALIVNCIFLLNNVFYCVALLQNCICLRYVYMLTVIVCLTSLKYMVLKTLVRTSSFRLVNLFYDISFIFCCIFLRDLGKHVFLQLDKTVYQFTFFCYFGSAIAFILHSVYSYLRLILQRCTFSKFHFLQISGKHLINDS